MEQFPAALYADKMKKLTHLDKKGRARMVNVAEKRVTDREAVAAGSVSMKKATIDLISEGSIPKGECI